MSSLYGNGLYWRTAANNARAMAETFTDESARLAMLEMAIRFEAIARRAHTLETGSKLADDTEQEAG